MKHLEEVPWFICDEGDVNYVSYSDTDSIYIHAEPLLNFLYPNFKELKSEDKDNKLEEVALKYQDVVNEHYDKLALECFNSKDHRFKMKTECVIRSAYFRNTRRYAQWITKENGVVKENIDIKGLEFKKANFAPLLGKFFEETIINILKGAKKEEIDVSVNEFRKQILDGSIPLNDLATPTAIKTLNNYWGRKAKAGEMFSVIYKGAPAPVKAAIKYNDLLKFWKLNRDYSYITPWDKVKWIYLKPNPYQIEAIAFLDWELPEKIMTFIEKYADRNKIFESASLNKIEGLYDDLQWELNFNPYIDVFFNFN